MNYLKFLNLKIGDSVTIKRKPPFFSRFNNVKVIYPHTFIVKRISNIVCGETNFVTKPKRCLAIVDTNGYAWLVNRDTYHLLQKNNNLNNRRNRIENLNL